MSTLENVTFGIAIESMKHGYFFRRLAWAEDESVYLLKGVATKAALDAAGECGPLKHMDSMLFLEDDNFEHARFPTLARKSRHGTEIGWCPTHQDLFAEDWALAL